MTGLESKVWSQADWRRIERDLITAATNAPGDDEAWSVIARQARAVLQQYSTSFFAVTRFLPPRKRAQVEVIYASVRYPDEIVDTFPLGAAERLRCLEEWRDGYDQGLRARRLHDALGEGVPPFLAAFTRVVRETGIPEDHYRSFLDAMRLDVEPRPFSSLSDLIDSYIYGSAIVVGFFLTHVYGPASPRDFDRALESARNLGIALQLTNFVRDVGEDQRRGRQYLPLDLLAEEGIAWVDTTDLRQHEGLRRVIRKVAQEARVHYGAAQRNLDAFAPDSRSAIQACIDVYGQLNDRILRSEESLARRESVPMTQKFRVLPSSKYWRLPLAYLGW
ncbi:MAG: phytoene/squalene synthase family protein [Candidatus Hydrogenedentes bacterium]|nr:phytoene/squalene synthase family protein [Candidatus Hydrogenedentota bacterium]